MGTTCCAASCGVCGGQGCGGREGGSASCCFGPIQQSGLSCTDNPPPCVVGLPVNPGNLVNPFCARDSNWLGSTAGGIRDESTGACCAESCGSCGNDTAPDSNGDTCEDRAGGSSHCCVSNIRDPSAPSNSCEFQDPPCYSAIHDGITFEHWQAGAHPWHPLNTVVDSTDICEGNNPCLETEFVPNGRGTERVVDLTPLPQGLEYTLTYDVKFSDTFEFVRGGKLHGLGPADHISGCSPMTDTGWSSRVMWLAEGELIIYLYHQDKTRNCGHVFRSGVYFTRGQWETVSLYTKVNSAFDAFDGKVQLYLNGILIAEALDIRLVDEPGWAVPHSEGYIANFMFSAFHGGSKPDWSPTTTQKAWIDNISVVPGHYVPTQPNITTDSTMNNETATARSGIARTGKAATVLPAPKSYDGHKLSCMDEGALPFDDTIVDGNSKDNNPGKSANLRFGFSGGPGLMRGTSDRISIRLHTQLKLVYEDGASTGDFLKDAPAVTVLREITGSYFNRLFSTTNDSAFSGKNAKYSMEDVQIDSLGSEFPVKFVSHLEMDGSDNSPTTSSNDMERLMTNNRLLNEYLKQLKKTSSSSGYRHVKKIVLRVIHHGGGQ